MCQATIGKREIETKGRRLEKQMILPKFLNSCARRKKRRQQFTFYDGIKRPCQKAVRFSFRAPKIFFPWPPTTPQGGYL